MDSSRQEYPAVLATLQPDQAINVLDGRIILINKVNTDIADFLQERRKIEERYATDLRKLARRPHAENSAALGVFDIPWQRIVGSTESLAQSHETFASKIETDVETPLRQFSTKSREMQAVTTIQGNISSIARDLGKAKEKADKLEARGGRKADNASSSVDSASREWESQSPYVFEQLQALDETRVNHLRDVLTQFQTHELDQLEKGRASTENCLNALLNVETADEIKTFAVRISEGGGMTTQQRAADQPRSSVGNIPPAPPPPRNSESRHNSTPNSNGLASVPEATPDKKSKIGGLKRLGTVMRGKKGAAPPPPQGAMKEKGKSRGFAPFRRGDSSRSFQDLEETGRGLTPVTSAHDRGGSPPRLPSLEQRPSSQSQEPANVMPTEFNGIPESQRNQGSDLPAPLVPTLAHQVQQPTLQPQPQLQAQPQPPVFSSSTHETQNITTPERAERIDPSYLNQNSDEPARNLMIRDEPIPEDAGEAQLALNNVANQLRLQAQNSGMSRPQGSVRGRRDVRNTIFVQNGTEIPGLSTQSTTDQPPASSPVNQSTSSGSTLALASPIVSPSATRAHIPALLEEQATGSDANSIHSAHTLAGIAQHPELHDLGLNASIVETVSTWFSETGITKSFVVGEVAFSHITAPGSPLADTETIRLRNFHVLEKVAVNPMFVKRSKPSAASSEEQAGSYNVELAAIHRPTPVVGLKYQLHLNETELGRYSPILITPAWQIIEGQASVIVLYELNPAFVLATSTEPLKELTVKNAAISVSLDSQEPTSGRATSAMMAPTQGASFRRKANSVIWRFAELKVTANKERLLVRFMTEGGLPKKGSIEVKFEAPDITAGNLGVERVNGPSHLESDPFADEAEARKSGEGISGSWEEVPTKQLLISGRYSAA